MLSSCGCALQFSPNSRARDLRFFKHTSIESATLFLFRFIFDYIFDFILVSLRFSIFASLTRFRFLFIFHSSIWNNSIQTVLTKIFLRLSITTELKNISKAIFQRSYTSLFTQFQGPLIYGPSNTHQLGPQHFLPFYLRFYFRFYSCFATILPTRVSNPLSFHFFFFSIRVFEIIPFVSSLCRLF